MGATRSVQRALLTRHFLRGFLHSELVPKQADPWATLAQVLGLVATPGFVVMCFLMRKYARLEPMPEAVRQLASLDEKMLFIHFSMVIVGFAAVVEWDTLFPDRRDFLILNTLPVKRTTVFASKAAALAIFVGLFAAASNAIPILLYPAFATRELLQTARHIAGHAVSVVMADAFVFFACVAIQGLLMSMVGRRWAVRVSRLAQLVLLVSLLSLFFLIPAVSFARLSENRIFLQFFAPAWFLGLHEVILAGPDAVFSPLAVRALVSFSAAMAIFGLSYLLAYRWGAREPLEAWAMGHAAGVGVSGKLRRVANSFFWGRSGTRASFGFTIRTLARSQPHRNCIGAYLGVGLAFVVMGIVTIVSRHGLPGLSGRSPELLSAPLALNFFVLLGMRVALAVPVQLKANWLFQLAEGVSLVDVLSGVRNAFVAVGVLPILALALPVYAVLCGWQTALVHVCYCAILCLILTHLMLFRLDRIPFTCPYTPGKANLKLWWWAYLFGFTTYAYSMTELEQFFFAHPFLFAAYFPVSISLLLGITRWRRRCASKLHGFRFEAEPPPSPEPLVLTSS